MNDLSTPAARPAPLKPYMALALQPQMRGAHQRADIMLNIEHIAELMHAAVWLCGIDLPVRLMALPEGALQGFTDEIFDWDHEEYVDKLAIDLPGPESRALGDLARHFKAYVIAQAKVTHPQFPRRFFNCGFILGPDGTIVHRHYKLQVFAREHSTVPHDVWDRWVELHGTGLDAFFPVAQTDIGNIGINICMEGSFPETARGLAMNGAEIIYRPSYPEPYVANGIWEVQNRARAIDNTCFVIAPNPGSYLTLPDGRYPIDAFGGNSMLVDYQGRVISNHRAGGNSSWAGGVLDVEALREYRADSLWGNWLKDLRTEQYRLIYDAPVYPKNVYLEHGPVKHAGKDALFRASARRLQERGIWRGPAVAGEEVREPT